MMVLWVLVCVYYGVLDWMTWWCFVFGVGCYIFVVCCPLNCWFGCVVLGLVFVWLHEVVVVDVGLVGMVWVGLVG